MWWKSGKVMATLFFPEVDEDEDSHVTFEEFKELMHMVALPDDFFDKVDEAYNKYASTPEMGLTHQEIAVVLEEWAWGVLNPVFVEKPYWYDFGDEVLYEGMRANMRNIIIGLDHNYDGRVVLSEYLDGVHCPIKD